MFVCPACPVFLWNVYPAPPHQTLVWLSISDASSALDSTSIPASFSQSVHKALLFDYEIIVSLVDHSTEQRARGQMCSFQGLLIGQHCLFFFCVVQKSCRRNKFPAALSCCVLEIQNGVCEDNLCSSHCASGGDLQTGMCQSFPKENMLIVRSFSMRHEVKEKSTQTRTA